MSHGLHLRCSGFQSTWAYDYRYRIQSLRLSREEWHYQSTGMLQSVAVARLALPPAGDVLAASFGVRFESVTQERRVQVRS